MLQGSLDNFALDEVLGLLSSTAKTGKLKLEGDRGNGSLSLRHGQLIQAEASFTSNGTAPEDVVFELLRYENGTFSFEVIEVDDQAEGREVGEVLASAEGRLADWRTIEAVVPTLDHRVTPADALPSEEVKINRAEWATLRIIAAGCPASLVCDELGLGEVEGSRQIKGLAERGLVTVDAPVSRTPSIGSNRGGSRDPFARRAAAAAERPSPPSFGTDPGRSADDGRAVAADKVRGGRPPMPAAPSPEELRTLTDDGERQPVVAAVAGQPGAAANGGNGNGANAAESADPKAGGGLLMRYLKNDE